MDLAAEIMVFLEGPPGPGMLELRGDGSWGIDASTGASVVFTLGRPTREAVAVAYFWRACDELCSRAPLSRRVGESSSVIAKVDARRAERARSFADFASRVGLKR